MHNTTLKKLIWGAFVIEGKRAIAWALMIFTILYFPLTMFATGVGNSILIFCLFLPVILLATAFIGQIIMSWQIKKLGKESYLEKFDHKFEIQIEDINKLISSIELEMKKYVSFSYQSENKHSWISYSKYSLSSTGEIIYVSLNTILEQNKYIVGISSKTLMPSLLGDNRKNIEIIQSLDRAIHYSQSTNSSVNAPRDQSNTP